MADLGLYDVTVRGFVTQMQLTKDDAESLYGDDAKKVGNVETTDPEPVSKPSFGDGLVEEDGDSKPADAKQAAPARNKARTTEK